jgi:amino acid transporter
VLSSVIIALICIGVLVAFVAFFMITDVVFHYSNFLPLVVIELIGSVITDAFVVLVPTPLFYLYGRALFKDLENARGYTYTDDEKKNASRVVVWAPIVSLIGIVVLIAVFATSIANVMQNAKSNLQQARERTEAERMVPARGLNR